MGTYIPGEVPARSDVGGTGVNPSGMGATVHQGRTTVLDNHPGIIYKRQDTADQREPQSTSTSDSYTDTEWYDLGSGRHTREKTECIDYTSEIHAAMDKHPRMPSRRTKAHSASSAGSFSLPKLDIKPVSLQSKPHSSGGARQKHGGSGQKVRTSAGSPTASHPTDIVFNTQTTSETWYIDGGGEQPEVAAEADDMLNICSDATYSHMCTAWSSSSSGSDSESRQSIVLYSQLEEGRNSRQRRMSQSEPDPDLYQRQPNKTATHGRGRAGSPDSQLSYGSSCHSRKTHALHRSTSLFNTYTPYMNW